MQLISRLALVAIAIIMALGGAALQQTVVTPPAANMPEGNGMDGPGDGGPSMTDDAARSLGPHPRAIEDAEGMLSGLDESFVMNCGQLPDAGVECYVQGQRLRIDFLDSEVRFHIFTDDGTVVELGLNFPGSRDVDPEGVDALGHSSNFFIGNDPARWATHVDSYDRLTYRELWPGIDLVFDVVEGTLKYEFIVNAGANPFMVSLCFHDASEVLIEGSTGELEIVVDGLTLTDQAPLVYQPDLDGWTSVQTGYRMLNRTTVGFDISDIDPTIPLVIDPGLEFSTYFGGHLEEQPRAIHHDKEGNILIAGSTNSVDLPTTTGAFCETAPTNPPYNARNGFIAKFNSNCTELLACTYVGGGRSAVGVAFDNIWDLDIDADGHVLCGGYTDSMDFPVTGDAISPSLDGESDGFLVVLDGDISTLTYSSYLGGSDMDWVRRVSVHPDGDPMLVFITNSTDFPTTAGAFCSTYNGATDLALMKISLDSNALSFSTYLGGSGTEDSWWPSIDYDRDGNIIMAANTNSTDFKMVNDPLSASYLGGSSDIIILLLKSDGSELLYSSYFGGTSADWLRGMIREDDGEVWLFGTGSDDIPLTDDAFSDTGWGFFSRFSDDLESLIYSSRLSVGEDRRIPPEKMALGPNGDPVFASRVIDAPNLPTPTTAFDRTIGGRFDVYFIWIDIANRSIWNATYLGGEDDEYVESIGCMADGTFLIAGKTSSSDFPTSDDAFCQTWTMHYDAFISCLDLGMTPQERPRPPTNLTVAPGDCLVNLRWALPTGFAYWPARGVLVHVGENDSCGDWTIELPLSRNCTISGLTNNRTYFFSVGLTSFIGEGDRSATIECTPFGIPSPPVGLEAVPGYEHVNVTWSSPSDMRGMELAGYRLIRGLATDNLTSLAVLSANETTYTDTDVTAGTVYHYQVLAFHRLADGMPSPVVSALPYGPPGPPQGLVAEAGDREVALSWGPPASDGGLAIVHYNVYRGLSPTSLELLAAVSDTSYVDELVPNGIVFHYAVQAVNTAAKGPLGAVVSATPLGPPGAPEGLMAEEGDGQVRLSWLPPTDTGGAIALDYVVAIVLSDGTRVSLTGVYSGTSSLIVGLENGRTYTYCVYACNLVGAGPFSESIEVTPMGPPDPPAAITAIAGLGRVALSWLAPLDDGGSAIVRYRVFKGLSPDDMVLLASVDGSVLTLDDTDIQAGIVYYYRVSALNARLEGGPSEVASATPFGLPGPPAGLTATVTDGQVVLVWESPLSLGGLRLTGYGLYQGAAPDGLSRARTLGNITTLALADLVNGRTYYFALAALNDAGEGPLSTVVPVIPLGRPGIVTGLTATVVRGTVILTWRAPADIGGAAEVTYVLYRGPTPTTMAPLVELGDVTTYTDITVEKGITFHYCIVARNSVGDGERSAPAEAMLRQPIPTEPAALPILPISIGLLVILGALAAASATETGRYGLVSALLPLLVRFRGEDVLDNRIRYAIQGLVIEKPGIHYHAIVKEIGISPGVAVYHLKVLEQENYIQSVRDGRLKRYFSTNTKIPRDLRMTPETVRQAMGELISSRPGISQKEIVEELGIDRETVRYHLRELVRDGTLESLRKGKYTTYVTGSIK